MEQLELINYNPDPVKSAVMSRAAELRDEGYDNSDALSMAWHEVEGDGADAGEDYEMMLEPRPRRRPRASNPTDADSGLGLGLLLGGVAGYLAWCFFKSTYRGLPWSWTPWKTTVPVSRRLTTQTQILPRPSFDATIVDHHSKQLYHGKDFTEESISLIMP